MAPSLRYFSLFTTSLETNQFREPINDYRTKTDDKWQKVIATAQQYGFEPDAICQLLELNAKIATRLKQD